MEPRELDRLARRHRGLVTLDEARSLGFGRPEWNAAIADGAVERRHDRVIRLFGAPTSPEQRIQAAVLAAGDGAMASHRSAARLWGVERPDDDPVDIILPCRTRRARLDDVVVHRPRDVVDLDPVWRRGIASTNPLRTLVDLGAVAPDVVSRALHQFVIARFVTPFAIRTLLLRHSRQGRHGVVALRAAIDAWALDDRPADSELEVQMAMLAARFDLPSMEFHARVAGYEVDFLVVGTRVVIECDGWIAHGADRDQFEFDRVRDAAVLAEGFVTQHVTWRQMVVAPAAAARRIEKVITRWAPDVLQAHRSLRRP